VQEKRHSPPAKLRFTLRRLFFVGDLADPLYREPGAFERFGVVLQRTVKVDERHRQAVAFGPQIVSVCSKYDSVITKALSEAARRRQQFEKAVAVEAPVGVVTRLACPTRLVGGVTFPVFAQ
jgi:hypothetical protein